MVWVPLVLGHQHTSCSTRKAGAPLPQPCQGSSDQPGQERAAANTPLFTKYLGITSLTLHRGRRQILANAKGICSPLPLSAHGTEGPLLLCPTCWPVRCLVGNAAGGSRHPCSQDSKQRAVTRTGVFYQDVFMCARRGFPKQRGPKSE